MPSWTHRSPVYAPDVAGFLREVPFFAGLDPDAHAEIAGLSRIVRVQAGSWLLHRGDEGDALHVVTSGRFEVVDEDRDAVIGVLGRGDVIGELALLTGEPRLASIRALRDSEVVTIDRQAFTVLLASNPAFAVSVTRTLGERFRQQSLGATAELARRRTRVVTLVPAAPSVPLREVAEIMATELGGPRRVALVTSRDAAADEAADARDPSGAYGRRLDACERTHDLAVLLASDDPDAPWTQFSVRSSDRTVVVAPASAPPPAWARSRPYGACDVALWSPRPPTAAQLAPWFSGVRPRTHHWLREGDGFAASVGRMSRRLVGRALGVVLSGGGARGLAHIGVIGALKDAGVKIDRLGGTSMGAFVSALFALGLASDQVRRLCRRELVERKPFADYGVPTAGLIRGRRADAMLRRVFGSVRAEELPVDWFAVSADLCSAETVVHRRGAVHFVVGASMSLPGLAPPVVDGDRLLVDGGVLNNLPVDVMAAGQEGPIIAVDVMGRAGQGWGERHRAPSWRPLDRAGDHARLPTIVETMAWSSGLGSRRHVEDKRRLADLTVTPELTGIGLLDWRLLDAAVDRGRAAAEAVLEQAGALGRLDPGGGVAAP